MSNQIFLNVNFTKDSNSFRALELYDFHSQNFASTNPSPLDGTTTRIANNKVNLFVVKKRLIVLMDLWNRFLNSGLFVAAAPNLTVYGSNRISYLSEWLFRPDLSTYAYNFTTVSIYKKLLDILEALAKNDIYYKANGTNNGTYFTSISTVFSGKIYSNFDSQTLDFKNLVQEFVNSLKDLLDEVKLITITNYMFNDMNTSNPNWSNAISIIKPLIYNNYNSVKRLVPDGEYPNDRTKDTELQFCIEIKRNAETNNPWLIKNILIDTSNNTLEKKKSKIGCTMLQMKTPIVANETININWNDPMDKPYVMLYSGSTVVFIPEEVKNNVMVPDTQVNLSAKFWSIGTNNISDPDYNLGDDIKLKLNHPLKELRKLNYFDSLTLLLKLDPY